MVGSVFTEVDRVRSLDAGMTGTVVRALCEKDRGGVDRKEGEDIEWVAMGIEQDEDEGMPEEPGRWIEGEGLSGVSSGG